jgi:hypothetical protein
MKTNPLDRNAATARAALKRVATLTVGIDTQTKMCRKAWYEYGRALLRQRERDDMRSTKAFGAWVRTHRLDQGLAASKNVRSDAIWMAEHWAELKRFNSEIREHHPTGVRQQCRDAGHAWAFDQHGKPAPPTDLLDSDAPADDLPAGCSMEARRHARKYGRWLDRVRPHFDELVPAHLALGATKSERERIAKHLRGIATKIEHAEKEIVRVDEGARKSKTKKSPVAEEA